LSSEVIGLIEIDAGLPSIGWGLPRSRASLQLGLQSSDCTARMTVGMAYRTEFDQTEFVEADSPQMAAELEAEFSRLMRQILTK
jgi:hypothetical protein